MIYLLPFFLVSLASNIQCGVNTNSIEETLIDTNDINAWIAKDQDPVQDVVRIDLYYETLCPYCIKLYIQELAPLVQKLSDYIDVHTYPFGNAKMIKTDEKTTFECQHGPKECYGNALHACAIHYLYNLTQDYDKYIHIYFNSCLMQRNSTDEAVGECFESLGIYPVPIKSCAKGDEAIKLLTYYAEETAKIIGRKYVPYTIINRKVMDSDDSLMTTVCAAFKNPPKECQRN